MRWLLVKRTLKYEGNSVREFYSGLVQPVSVGIEATGSMQCLIYEAPFYNVWIWWRAPYPQDLAGVEAQPGTTLHPVVSDFGRESTNCCEK